MPRPDYVRWLRDRIGPERVILPYTSAIITDEQGRLLLQRRSDFPWWGLPGGVLEPGERLEACLIREVREETGLAVRPERLVGLYSSPDFDVTYPNGDQVQQFTVCFACRVVGGTAQPDGHEAVDQAYFAPDHLPQVPLWYRAMIDDATAGRGVASFRQGRPGKAGSRATIPWLRQFVGHDPILMVGGGAFVCDEAGQVLLVRRSDHNIWGLPAGAMELGERIDTAVAREVLEETGLLVEIERLVGAYAGPEFFVTYPGGDQAFVVTTFFTTRIVGGAPRPDDKETLAVRFFAPDQLPPLRPLDQMRLDDAFAGQTAAVWR